MVKTVNDLFSVQVIYRLMLLRYSTHHVHSNLAATLEHINFCTTVIFHHGCVCVPDQIQLICQNIHREKSMCFDSDLHFHKMLFSIPSIMA